VDRRTFLSALSGSLLAAPLAAEAQQADKLHRIGFLHVADGSFSLPYLKAALADLGYVEGKSLILETRFAHGSVDRLPALAAELAAAKVEVIMAAGDQAVRAANNATKTIPIVMAFASLPVEHGFVKSLARPGGNITGVTVISDPNVDAKRIELLPEVAPKAKVIAILQVVGTGEGESAAVERATRTLGVRLVVVKVRPGDYEAAFATMNRERADALFVGRGPAIFMARRALIELVARHRIPAIWEARVMVEDGGLLSYGPSFPDLYRRIASVVDRIVKGANPAELPVEQPTKFELVINLKTAKALGLTIPQSVLQRADQVIE
jgi:putative ABC transport system substrate-binding protein